MNIKRLLCAALAVALALSATACAPAADTNPTGTPGRVEDPFAQPTPTPAPDPTAPPATSAPAEGPSEAPAGPHFTVGWGGGYGFTDIDDDIDRGLDVKYVYDEKTTFQYRTYDGGELSLPVLLYTQNNKNVGIGVLLFVDGMPQPYRLEEEAEYTYMHTFYTEDGTYYPDLYFIPVTGQEGDNLEVRVFFVVGPEVVPTVSYQACPPYSTLFRGSGCRIQFNATPPAQELPETVNRILSQTVSYEDTTYMDTASWTADDLMQKISAQCSTPEMGGGTNDMGRYNISADTPIKLRFEVYGSPLVDYRLVYFLDNVPVAVDPEDLAFIEVESGRKTIVETVIDLSGFDGFSILYPLLVPVNQILTYEGERQPDATVALGAHSPVTFLLSGAADNQEMLEMNSALVGETP